MLSRDLGRLARAAVASLLVAPAGCRHSTAVPATVLASASADGLVLIDRAPVAIGFVAMSEQTSVVIDWIPVATPAIQSGASVTVPRSQIVGFAENGGPVLVYWWGVRPAAGGGYEFAPGVGGTLRVSGL